MIAFVRRNQVLLSSFLSVLVSLYILASAARGRLRTDPIGPLLLAVMRPLQIGAQTTVVRLRELPARVGAFRSLVAENEGLRKRVTELEAERNRLLEAEATTRRLQELLQFRSDLPSGSITASVIGSSASTWFHSLLLDKGSRDGIRKGMAVVSPLGVVGQVVAATSRSSKVLLLTDPNSGVDALVQGSRARGIVSGSLDNGPLMKYVKRSEEVKEGDRLVTSGLDGLYPKGLLIGTVTKVNKKSFGLFQYVKVALAVDPSEIEEVLVVPGEKVD
ncbi:MAG TPA: rod shape-determining protein MreC [Candidatus Binatia bacterium]|jgi:rod shape-determining protein MreC|nr:rod shape-determining protein MreC [Candidatus Binatia bacterium]